MRLDGATSRICAVLPVGLTCGAGAGRQPLTHHVQTGRHIQ